jgi:tripartite-type tricarboxylate transporter receptor subunit TctC
MANVSENIIQREGVVMKKAIAAALLAGMISPVSAIAQNAESYPARDVTIIVPFAPGGGVDTVARPIAESLRRQFKRAFIIENRAGVSVPLHAQI